MQLSFHLDSLAGLQNVGGLGRRSGTHPPARRCHPPHLKHKHPFYQTRSASLPCSDACASLTGTVCVVVLAVVRNVSAGTSCAAWQNKSAEHLGCCAPGGDFLAEDFSSPAPWTPAVADPCSGPPLVLLLAAPSLLKSEVPSKSCWSMEPVLPTSSPAVTGPSNGLYITMQSGKSLLAFHRPEILYDHAPNTTVTEAHRSVEPTCSLHTQVLEDTTRIAEGGNVLWCADRKSGCHKGTHRAFNIVICCGEPPVSAVLARTPALAMYCASNGSLQIPRASCHPNSAEQWKSPPEQTALTANLWQREANADMEEHMVPSAFRRARPWNIASPLLENVPLSSGRFRRWDILWQSWEYTNMQEVVHAPPPCGPAAAPSLAGRAPAESAPPQPPPRLLPARQQRAAMPASSPWPRPWAAPVPAPPPQRPRTALAAAWTPASPAPLPAAPRTHLLLNLLPVMILSCRHSSIALSLHWWTLTPSITQHYHWMPIVLVCHHRSQLGWRTMVQQPRLSAAYRGPFRHK